MGWDHFKIWVHQSTSNPDSIVESTGINWTVNPDSTVESTGIGNEVYSWFEVDRRYRMRVGEDPIVSIDPVWALHRAASPVPAVAKPGPWLGWRRRRTRRRAARASGTSSAPTCSASRMLTPRLLRHGEEAARRGEQRGRGGGEAAAQEQKCEMRRSRQSASPPVRFGLRNAEEGTFRPSIGFGIGILGQRRN